ncbi:MAG: helix-turn-helix transcriptional regulator [Ruminococcus sp.]|jgi:two-component system response regulator YesN|nr:helix-turn-helix transcriptional regulator [Ruminococcus sp.]MBR5164052.1 helix-turn-helix transcriptional regulator [Ruminococcus sp.]
MNENKDIIQEVKRIDIKSIEELLQSGRLEDCGEKLDEILDEVNFSQIGSLVIRLYVCMDIYVAAHTFAEKIGISNECFYEHFGIADDIASKLTETEDTVVFLHKMIYDCIMWRIESAKESGKSVIASAREYIDNNYMNDELSLLVVAEAVGLSPSYLSAQFKKKYGQNLSEYIASARISRARELLCCTSKMIYEIAYDVGFRDYRYFSQIFKKYTGQTPRQFQNSANICP